MQRPIHIPETEWQTWMREAAQAAAVASQASLNLAAMADGIEGIDRAGFHANPWERRPISRFEPASEAIDFLDRAMTIR
jgi:hypothetical protein